MKMIFDKEMSLRNTMVCDYANAVCVISFAGIDIEINTAK